MPKPVAELTIIRWPSGSDAFYLTVDGLVVWNTRSAPTTDGREAAKERLRLWLEAQGKPYKVVGVGTVPAVVEEPALDDPEGQFWFTFGDELGGQEWSDVEHFFKQRMSRPTTSVGWEKLYDLVDQALKARDEPD